MKRRWNTSDYRTGNTPDWIEKLKRAEGKRSSRSLYWSELAQEIRAGLDGEVVRIKYNGLYHTFKKCKFEVNKSGGVPSSWKYYNVFDQHIKNMDDVFLPNVFELGDKTIYEQKTRFSNIIEIEKQSQKQSSQNEQKD